MATGGPLAESAALRAADASSTLREVSPELEAMLFTPIKVLDHGFIRVVDYMGGDGSVVQAARVSYGRGTKQVSEDRGLINYLMRHRHTTPFEMAEIKLHVKLPIFVARQWIRHRTASVNEYSARYSVLDNEFYVPEASHIGAQSPSNRQGRSDKIDADTAGRAATIFREHPRVSYEQYLELLNLNADGSTKSQNGEGVARELARTVLPVSFYTQWYWKTNLHNLMNFLQLRADPHAQFEIRVYADAILEILRAWVPLTFEAFREHRLGAVTLSATAAEALRRALSGERVTHESSNLTKREWQELQERFNLRDG